MALAWDLSERRDPWFWWEKIPLYILNSCSEPTDYLCIILFFFATDSLISHNCFIFQCICFSLFHSLLVSQQFKCPFDSNHGASFPLHSEQLNGRKWIHYLSVVAPLFFSSALDNGIMEAELPVKSVWTGLLAFEWCECLDAVYIKAKSSVCVYVSV